MRKTRAANSENVQQNVFKAAVEATPDITFGYCNGLQAFKSNSSLLKVANTRKLLGSVDIDDATKNLYPQDARWDYAVGYEDNAYFVEVHPANTSNVAEMAKKAKWLETWLKDKAGELAKIRDGNLLWIPSGKVAILKSSPQYRSLAQHKLVLTTNPFTMK